MTHDDWRALADEPLLGPDGDRLVETGAAPAVSAWIVWGSLALFAVALAVLIVGVV